MFNYCAAKNQGDGLLTKNCERSQDVAELNKVLVMNVPKAFDNEPVGLAAGPIVMNTRDRSLNACISRIAFGYFLITLGDCKNVF